MLLSVSVCRVNVFREGKGTITIWENIGGTRGSQVYQLKGIPLTPGAAQQDRVNSTAMMQ